MANLLSIAPPLARYVLRTRDPAALEAIIGLKLPTQIGETQAGISKLGPDEWFALLQHGTPAFSDEAGLFSIVDVSERSVGIVIEGPSALEVLSAGCPLDLSLWPIGRASRTIFELVEVIIIRQGKTRFHVEVWHSFAPWLWEALNAVANQKRG